MVLARVTDREDLNDLTKTVLRWTALLGHSHR